MSTKIQKVLSGRKVGLALGSGSARGWAHIGVIEAITEAGIKIDYIAGTSIGALVGSAYAAGKLPVLKELALQLDWRQLLNFFDPALSKSGIIDGKKIADFIRDNIEDSNIESLQIPFRAVSTDLNTGQEIIISKGKIIDAIRASISIPGMFTPVKRGKYLLVDGALVNPLPVSVVRQMGADFVIAVDLNYGTQVLKSESAAYDEPSHMVKSTEADTEKTPDAIDSRIKSWIDRARELGRKVATLDFIARAQMEKYLDKDPLPNIFEVILSSYNILEVQVTETRLKTEPADILIRPQLSSIRFMELNRAKEAIDEGHRAAIETIASVENISIPAT